MGRKSKIVITEAAYRLSDDLPTTEEGKQKLKNWILSAAHEKGAELLDSLEEVPATDEGFNVLNFGPDYYAPMGLQIVIYRHKGLQVLIDTVD